MIAYRSKENEKIHKTISTDCLADTHFAVFLLFTYSQRKVLINKTAAYFVNLLSEKRIYIWFLSAMLEFVKNKTICKPHL